MDASTVLKESVSQCGPVSGISRLEPGSLSPFSYLVLALMRNGSPIIMLFQRKKGDFIYDCSFKWFPGKFHEKKKKRVLAVHIRSCSSGREVDKTLCKLESS